MDMHILLLLFYLLNNNTIFSSQNNLHTIKNYLSSIEIEKNYTKEKIRIGKKLVPLLPLEYSSSVNKSITITEKIIRIIELVEFINSHEETAIAPLDLEPKVRIQKIIYTIQDEMNNSDIDQFGMILDLIFNMDKYKKLLNAYTNLSKKSMSDSEKISILMETFMDSSIVKDKEKINDMLIVFDMLKVLNEDDYIDDKPNKD